MLNYFVSLVGRECEKGRPFFGLSSTFYHSNKISILFRTVLPWTFSDLTIATSVVPLIFRLSGISLNSSTVSSCLCLFKHCFNGTKTASGLMQEPTVWPYLTCSQWSGFPANVLVYCGNRAFDRTRCRGRSLVLLDSCFMNHNSSDNTDVYPSSFWFSLSSKPTTKL